MKASGAPEVGDLVFAKYDVERDVAVTGLVLECRGIECLVVWYSENQPKGWWRRDALKVINE